MGSIEITLVRHGESEANVADLWQGQGDSALTEQGRTQAQALATRLSEEHFDLVISSDLRRAHHTASELISRVETLPEWREMDIGEWEGLTMQQVAEKFPEQIEALRRREAIPVGGGESWSQLFARVDKALERTLQRLRPGQRAIVFTHGAVIAALMGKVIGRRSEFPSRLGRMRNTAMSTLRFSHGQVQILRHNDATHAPQSQHKGFGPMQEKPKMLFCYASEKGQALPSELGQDADLRNMENHAELFHSVNAHAHSTPQRHSVLALQPAQIQSCASQALGLHDSGNQTFAPPILGHQCRIALLPSAPSVVEYNVPWIRHSKTT